MRHGLIGTSIVCYSLLKNLVLAIQGDIDDVDCIDGNIIIFKLFHIRMGDLVVQCKKLIIWRCCISNLIEY